MNSKGILNFDWPLTKLLSGGGLHYGQKSFGGETLYMDEKMIWMPMTRTLFRREVLHSSSFLGNLKALDKKLDLQRTPT